LVGREVGAANASGRATGERCESGAAIVCSPGSELPVSVGAERLAPIGEKVMPGAFVARPAGPTGTPPTGAFTDTEAIGAADNGAAANTANAATEAMALRNASRHFISLGL
jgi:hypothetical protein